MVHDWVWIAAGIAVAAALQFVVSLAWGIYQDRRHRK